MPGTRRFERIARDLEKLPCELHGPVLIDLEFEQLIRLSLLAGPRLTWSLENSLSPWRIFFRQECATKVQKLLAVTDQIKCLCFKHPSIKGWEPPSFERGRLCFLHHRDPDWSSPISYASRNLLHSRESLVQHWIRAIHGELMDTIRSVFQVNYSKLVGPWLDLLIALPKFQDGSYPVSVILKLTTLAGPTYGLNTQPPLSIEELANIVDLNQQLRHIRAFALAGELRRLALLYEAHPTRLKQPFAPQTRRKNEKHVPNVHRIVADKLEAKAKHTSWKARRKYGSRFSHPFPALVPYNWCMQLFVKVLQKPDLSESSYPAAMVEKCRMVLEAPPRWAATAPEATPALATSTQATDDPIAEVSKGLGQLALQSVPRLHTQLLFQETGNAYCTRPESELQWLETFVEVVAWMEEEFPDVLLEVRGRIWDERL